MSCRRISTIKMTTRQSHRICGRNKKNHFRSSNYTTKTEIISYFFRMVSVDEWNRLASCVGHTDHHLSSRRRLMRKLCSITCVTKTV